MILVKYIPNQLSKEGRIDRNIDYSSEFTVLDYLIKSNFCFDDCKIIKTGRACELNEKAEDGDEIIIIAKISIPAAWLVALGFSTTTAAAISAVTTVIAWVVVIASAIYSIVTALTARKPNFNSDSSGLDANSPTYSFDGIVTQKQVGLPIGICYGQHKLGGNIVNEFVHTDGDNNYMNMLIGLCEGEIDSISDIKINDNPIANYSGCASESKLGTNSQTPVTNFEQLHDVHNTANALTKNNSVVYTTSGLAVEAFELHLTLSGGLWTIGPNGDLQPLSVDYLVEYKLHTDPTYISLGSTSINDNSRTTLRRIFRKDGLTPGQYDIRITKTSDDSTATTQTDMELSSVDEITNADLAYPNTALLGVKILATSQLNGATPNVTCIVKGSKVLQPDILTAEGGNQVDWEDYYYDPITSQYKLLADDTVLYWNGTSYTTKWCANPVWCIRDLFTNTRYGLGEFIDSSMIDLSSFLEMSQYCDERVPDGRGGYEKRFMMDIMLDSSTKALDMLMQMVTTFNGLLFYSQGLIKLKIDKVDIPVQLFGMGNIIEGSFVQNWASIRDIPNVIEVQYLDKDKDYQQEQVAVIDETALTAGDSLRKKQVRTFCTRQSQAIRHGRYILKLAKYNTRALSLKVGIDAMACQAGDVVNVSHDVPAWGNSGRVRSGSTDISISIDQTVVIVVNKTYQLTIMHNDDTIETKTVTSTPGNHSTLIVGSAFSFIPSAYDKYAFGEVGKVVKPYRIINIKRYNNLELELQLAEYNANVYDDSAIVLPTTNYSALTLTIPPVTDIAITERMVKLSDGKVEDCIDVWFNKPSLAGYSVKTFEKARIYLSSDGGLSWQLKGEATNKHFQLVGGLVDGVNYTIAITSVAYNGEETAVSSAPNASITLIGKSAPPSDVTAFLVNQSRDRLYFGWTNVNDIDLSGYEIRYGDNWESGEALASNIKTNSLIRLDFRTGNNQSFWIKAIDTSGNFSLNATEAVISVENIPFTNIIASYSEQTGWAGTKTNTSKVGDNLEVSTGELSGTYETPVRNIGYVATFKIGIDSIIVDATTEDRMNDSETERMNDSETDRMSGRAVAGAATFEIKTSEDNVTWSDYAPWQAGDYKCRYFQIRMTLTRASVATVIQCSQLNYYSDLPDVDEVQDGEVATAGDGCDITFSKTFHEDPALNITILTGDGLVWKATGLDTTGVNIKLYKLDGTAVTGTFRIHIHGI